MGVEKEILTPGDGATFPKAGDNLSSAFPRSSARLCTCVSRPAPPLPLPCSARVRVRGSRGLTCAWCRRWPVHYTGTLTNGTKFDSSVDRGQPFQFTIGMGQVIKGWDEGMMKMSVGQTAKLTCTPDYAYGERGFPPVIPPASTLIFEVELLGVK